MDPGLFENAILTSGQQANYQYGEWSDQENSVLAASWVGSVTDVTGSSADVPMTGNTFSFSGMTQDQAISMFQNAGFIYSPADTRLSEYTHSHPGVNMRGISPVCSIHLNILPGSGRNGKPVTGQFHTDLFSPLDTGSSALIPERTAAHAAADVFFDLLINPLKVLPDGWTGNDFCK